MMAWGRECSAWDDSVDKANCERFDCGDIPDGQFVMTTWHDDDSLEDVSHFAKFLANHPTTQLENVLVLDIGQSGRQELMEILYEQA